MEEKSLTKEDVVKIVKQEMKQGEKRESRPLTPYQKHMSVCLKKDNATFKGCIDEWNKKKK